MNVNANKTETKATQGKLGKIDASLALERWQQQLCELLTAVHRKQRQYDQATSACQLLLKPWPKSSTEKESAAQKDVPDKKDDQQLVQQEVAELKAVNDLLRRAQKTRVKTTAKTLKDHGSPVSDKIPSSTSGRESEETCDSESQSHREVGLKGDAESSHCKAPPVIKTSDKLQTEVGKARTEPSKINSQKQPLVQPVHARERLNQNSGSVSKRASATSSETKPTSTTSRKPPKSRESVENSRPPSRPRSGRGNFKPAHATAPFKTDPNLHARKNPVRNGARPVKQPPAVRRINHAGDMNCGNVVLPPIGKEKDVSPSVVSKVQEGNDTHDVCDTHSGFTNGEQHLISANQRNASLEEMEKKLNSLTVESGMGEDVPRQAVDVSGKGPQSEACSRLPEDKQEEEGRLFSLEYQGSSINIPAKVRRAFARNQQLRNKVLQRDTGRKTKSGGKELGQKFAHKLEQLFDPEEELVYRQQALECLHTHEGLLKVLTHLDLDHITDSSSATDILRTKMLAEFVLSSFSAFSEEVNLLNKVQFPDTPAVVQPSVRPASHLYTWLPTSLQGENAGSAENKLQYTSKSELSGYMNVLLRLQTLQCQRRLLDILISDVLPWLQQQDCSRDGFGAVFRGLFALLTSDGSQLPVLVHDNGSASS